MPISESDDLNRAVAVARARAAAEAEANAQQNPTVGQDVANSAPSYLARGAAGALDALNSGTPGGMVQTLAQRAKEVGWLPPSTPDAMGVGDVANTVAPDFMGREADTTPGKYAGAVAEALPYAAMGGPGGAVRGVVSNVTGSLVGEAADQAAKGGPLENFARLFGTVIGGGITAGRPGQLRPGVRAANEVTGAWNALRKRVLSGEELRTATDFAAQSLRDAGIHYDPNAFGKLGPEIFQRLKNHGAIRGSRGLDPMQSAAYQYVDELTRRAGTVPDFNDLERMTSGLGQRIRAEYQRGNTQLATALEQVQNGIDDFVSKVPFASMKTGAPKTSEELNAARAAYRDLALRNIKSRRIQEAMDIAEDDPLGFTSGINKSFKALVARPYNRKLFSDAERTMLSNVASGKSPITWLAKFGIDLGHPSAISNITSPLRTAGLGGAAAYFGGPVGAAAVVGPLLAGGTVAKSLVEPALKRKNAESVAGAIRTSSDAASTALDRTKQMTNWAKLRWLMLGAQGAAADDGQQVSTAPRG